jgi:hypothetical protein
MNCVLGWLTKYEAVAVWLEGIALVGLIAVEMWSAHEDRKETVEQLKLAQDQIRISQNAERAWVMTELEWSEQDRLKVVTGTSSRRGEESVETTTVIVKLVCRNDGRSPAWVDKVQGYCEIVQGKIKDLSSPVGHPANPFLPVGPVSPGNRKESILHLEAPGHLKGDQLLSLFVLVEYRDIFEKIRYTTCGFTVSGDYLTRQDLYPERNKMT